MGACECGAPRGRPVGSVSSPPLGGVAAAAAVLLLRPVPTTRVCALLATLRSWLNFQIEHHAWPQLSMLSYQKSAPLMRAICEKHGVPYVQENVFIRLKKLADVMVGAADMRPFPAEWEYEPDRFTWVDQRK
jgi:hypothetical protein